MLSYEPSAENFVEKFIYIIQSRICESHNESTGAYFKPIFLTPSPRFLAVKKKTSLKHSNKNYCRILRTDYLTDNIYSTITHSHHIQVISFFIPRQHLFYNYSFASHSGYILYFIPRSTTIILRIYCELKFVVITCR